MKLVDICSSKRKIVAWRYHGESTPARAGQRLLYLEGSDSSDDSFMPLVVSSTAYECDLFDHAMAPWTDNATCAGVSSVRIIRMKVPDVIQLGTVDAVTLDCEYVTKNVTGLVVKWFFMDKSQPVYQWIPPQKPQALGLLRNKLDLSVRVSHNPYTQHRALRILEPGTELTGNYTCVVSTFLAEDQRTSPMVIFVPEKRFTMVLDRLDDEYLNIICSVEAVFPSPNLTILVGNRPINAKQTVSSIKNRYTAVTSSVLRVSTLPSTVEVLCELHVPLANYISRKRDIFYRDPPAAGPEPPGAPADRAAPGKGHISASTPAPVLAAVLINLLTSHFQYT